MAKYKIFVKTKSNRIANLTYLVEAANTAEAARGLRRKHPRIRISHVVRVVK